MKAFIVSTLLIVAMSCNLNTSPIDNTIASNEVTEPVVAYVMNSEEIDMEPYELKLEMQKLKDNVYDFVVNIELNGGSYYVSPYAVRDFSGKFTIQIDDNKKLVAISKLMETPRSIEEYDPHPFVGGKVNWVRENTRYNQKLRRMDDDNFEIMGYIQFTIEPRCTLEKIPFIIKNTGGNLRVEVFQC